jgi:tRNA (guanine-N7-)-methyltransferase
LKREIKSYVLRQGRTTPSQQHALDALSPRYGIAFSNSLLNPAEIFERVAPVVLEIGSGMGETTAQIAQQNPAVDFIAVEVHGPGVGSLLKQIDALRLTNLRIIRHDAVPVLETMIADGLLAGIHLFFPDPWPKKRHHKRRLVQAPFAELAARKLAPGGYLHAATDWPEYAQQIDEVFSSSPLFEQKPQEKKIRPVTKFERRGIGLGHTVRDLLFVRRQE